MNYYSDAVKVTFSTERANELGLARRPSYFLPIKRSTQVASAYVNNLTYKIQAGKGGGGGVEVVKKTGRGHR